MKLLVDKESEQKLISQYRNDFSHSLKFEKSLNNKKILISGDSFGEHYFSLMAIEIKIINLGF